MQSGQHEIAEKLLSAGASVDFPDDSGDITPLMIAARTGHSDICLLLLNHGANINANCQNNDTMHTALHFAIDFGDLQTAGLLLEYGARIRDLTKPTDVDRTVLASAITSQKSHVLNFLLEYCNKSDVGVSLTWVFHVATFSGSEECAIGMLRHIYCPSSDPVSHVYTALPDVSYFLAASIGNFVKLMSIMAEIKPQFMQENWLLTASFAKKELRLNNNAFLSWLLEYRKQVPSLLKLCRSVIL